MSNKKSQSGSRRGRGASGQIEQRSPQGASSISSAEFGSALSQALRLHREGRLHDAKGQYRRLAKAHPGHCETRHLLGVVCHQLGDHAEAVRQFDATLRINPQFAAAHINRGVALEHLKRLDEAVASYDRAITLDPNDAGTHYNRGNALKELKRFDEAVISYHRALALDPRHAGAFYNRGNVLAQVGRFDEAVTSYESAIALKPDDPEAYVNRGIALHELKRFDEAVTSQERAIALNPGHAEALINRGITLHELRRFDAALASFDNAIDLKPDRAEAFNGRGNALQALRRFDAAVASYDKAIALSPSHAEALSNRCNALRELGRLDEALASCERAIARKPDHAEAWTNRGIVLMEMRRLDEALASYDRSIALKPEGARTFYNRGLAFSELRLFEEAVADYDQAIARRPDYADAFHNRSIALRELKRFSEAAESCARALALAPDHKYALSVLADCSIKVCDWAQREKLSTELRRHVLEGTSQVSPFLLLGYSDDAVLHLACAKGHVLDRLGATPQRLGSGEIWRNEKIKVAYVSCDFRHHATSLLMAELFELHDRSRFEVIGVSLGPDDRSDMRARIAMAFDQFLDVTTTSDEEVARLLGQLRIDVAVDLNGHTGGARPRIFAHRPAPIQVSYLGFPGTTGADFIDYVIADPIVLPFDQQPHYTESIVHLPDCYQMNDSKRAISSRAPSREGLGLPAQGLVFCCFNNNWKITPDVFGVWMRLLEAIEGSVLWLLRANEDAERNLCNEAAARGIDPARLVFADLVPVAEHLARHRAADLFLDTLPCNAHTTASDALWAGLPLLTCRGKAFAGRVAASLLNGVRLPELVTDNLEDYEAMALRLATDASLRCGLRDKLERNRVSAPLFDADRSCRHIEAAYTTMWEIWQRGERPRSFSVELYGSDRTSRSE
jgi:protein O-GlcNAc transferase